jgi:CRP-like cAMP-binding protein
VSVTQAGREGVVQQLSRGALLGEVAFFDGSLRTATVTATTPSTILSLEFERFRKFLLAYPDSALIIAERIVHMLRHAETALVELQRAQRIG